MEYIDLDVDPEKFEQLAKEDNEAFESVLWPILRDMGWGIPDATPEDMA